MWRRFWSGRLQPELTRRPWRRAAAWLSGIRGLRAHASAGTIEVNQPGLEWPLSSTMQAVREETAMEPGQMKYGVPNVVYDIIQTVGNLLQGVEKMLEYAGDAEEAGDADAATVFRTVAEGNRVAAQALLKRLKVHLSDF